MSKLIEALVSEIQSLHPSVKAILREMATQANDDGKCEISIASLQRRLSLSQSTIIRGLNKIVEQNLAKKITNYSESGFQKINKYILNEVLIDQESKSGIKLRPQRQKNYSFESEEFDQLPEVYPSETLVNMPLSPCERPKHASVIEKEMTEAETGLFHHDRGINTPLSHSSLSTIHLQTTTNLLKTSSNKTISLFTNSSVYSDNTSKHITYKPECINRQKEYAIAITRFRDEPIRINQKIKTMFDEWEKFEITGEIVQQALERFYSVEKNKAKQIWDVTYFHRLVIDYKHGKSHHGFDVSDAKTSPAISTTPQINRDKATEIATQYVRHVLKLPITNYDDMQQEGEVIAYFTRKILETKNEDCTQFDFAEFQKQKTLAREQRMNEAKTRNNTPRRINHYLGNTHAAGLNEKRL